MAKQESQRPPPTPEPRPLREGEVIERRRVTPDRPPTPPSKSNSGTDD